MFVTINDTFQVDVALILHFCIVHADTNQNTPAAQEGA